MCADKMITINGATWRVPGEAEWSQIQSRYAGGIVPVRDYPQELQDVINARSSQAVQPPVLPPPVSQTPTKTPDTPPVSQTPIKTPDTPPVSQTPTKTPDTPPQTSSKAPPDVAYVSFPTDPHHWNPSLDDLKVLVARGEFNNLNEAKAWEAGGPSLAGRVAALWRYRQEYPESVDYHDSYYNTYQYSAQELASERDSLALQGITGKNADAVMSLEHDQGYDGNNAFSIVRQTMQGWAVVMKNDPNNPGQRYVLYKPSDIDTFRRTGQSPVGYVPLTKNDLNHIFSLPQSLKRGGVVVGKEGRPVMIQVHGGEVVLPIKTVKELNNLLRPKHHGIVIREAAGLKEPVRNRPSSTKKSTKQPALTKANVRNLGGGIVETNYHGIRRRHLKL